MEAPKINPEDDILKAKEPEMPQAKKAQKLTKIKLTKIKPIRKPGETETQYGILFEIQDDGSMIGETFPEVAKAGIDAGLYTKV